MSASDSGSRYGPDDRGQSSRHGMYDRNDRERTDGDSYGSYGSHGGTQGGARRGYDDEYQRGGYGSGMQGRGGYDRPEQWRYDDDRQRGRFEQDRQGYRGGDSDYGGGSRYGDDDRWRDRESERYGTRGHGSQSRGSDWEHRPGRGTGWRDDYGGSDRGDVERDGGFGRETGRGREDEGRFGGGFQRGRSDVPSRGYESAAAGHGGFWRQQGDVFDAPARRMQGGWRGGEDEGRRSSYDDDRNDSRSSRSIREMESERRDQYAPSGGWSPSHDRGRDEDRSSRGYGGGYGQRQSQRSRYDD
jgi:hypothetical protein